MKFGLSLLLFIFLTCNLSMGTSQDITGLVPAAAELSPIIISAAHQVYNRDNLWEYINGAAPAYLHFGFQQVVTFVVMNPDSDEAVVDIYDMGDSLNAFGMYAQEKSAKGKPVTLGSGAVIYSNSLYFWQDRYYIKLIAYSSSPAIASFLTRLGGLISARLPDRGSLPQIFTLFPLQERVPGSERYYPQDVLGQAFLNNGYSAEYAAGEDQYTIFIIPFTNGQDAGEKYASLQNAKSPVETVPEVLKNIGDAAFLYKDSYYGSVCFIQKNQFITGVAGHIQAEKMQQIFASLAQTIP
ncbi:MAG TPA: hypothetical protein PLP19_12560 [bacterium]|nr:hypothetical protein [bacterium]HPN44317.1 hypothetical protein [bacterium]